MLTQLVSGRLICKIVGSTVDDKIYLVDDT